MILFKITFNNRSLEKFIVAESLALLVEVFPDAYKIETVQQKIEVLGFKSQQS